MDAKQLSFSKAMKNLPEKFSINNTRAQLKADHVATFEGLNVAYVINRPGDNGGQAEMAVHMLNWAIRSVKFLGVEFDQSEDEEVSVSDTTHL